MPIYTDQLSRTIKVPASPQRIVSLVPSQTELLYDLGLDREVAGITKFCVHPADWFRNKQRVGGTKTVHLEVIDALQPDLIIANKEENVREQVEALARRYPVWISDVNTLPDALDMICSVGVITGRAAAASQIARRINEGFSELKPISTPVKTAYLIWRDPYMTTGHDTFIHDQLRRCGLENVFGGQTRYPAITIGDLQAAGCELLLLSSEPYPFREKHLVELQSILPHTTILLADGEMFSWYGSRLLQAPAYFNELLNNLPVK